MEMPPTASSSYSPVYRDRSFPSHRDIDADEISALVSSYLGQVSGFPHQSSLMRSPEYMVPPSGLGRSVSAYDHMKIAESLEKIKKNSRPSNRNQRSWRSEDEDFKGRTLFGEDQHPHLSLLLWKHTKSRKVTRDEPTPGRRRDTPLIFKHPRPRTRTGRNPSSLTTSRRTQLEPHDNTTNNRIYSVAKEIKEEHNHLTSSEPPLEATEETTYRTEIEVQQQIGDETPETHRQNPRS
ncbi:Uncharacterized protein Rs2_00423 [Raphanus sativus]|nr:Uncharacterized protein Rs2_00423 [Raphanus sativus]